MFNSKVNVSILIVFLFGIFCFRVTHSVESIFTTPDVFITSKIKPTKDYESDRGNILHDSHELKKADNTLLDKCLKIFLGSLRRV